MNAESIKHEDEKEEWIITYPELQIKLLTEEVEYLELQLFDAKEDIGKVERQKDEIIAQLEEKLRNQQIQIDMYEENFDLKKINVNKKRLLDIEIQNKQIQKKKDLKIQELEEKNEKMEKEIRHLRYGDLVFLEKQAIEKKYYELKDEFTAQFVMMTETMRKLNEENQNLAKKVKEAHIDLIEANDASIKYMFQLADTQSQLLKSNYQNQMLKIRFSDIEMEKNVENLTECNVTGNPIVAENKEEN